MTPSVDTAHRMDLNPDADLNMTPLVDSAQRMDLKQDAKSSKDVKKFSSSFENLLEEIGSGGKFQWRLILWFMIPLSFIYGLSSSNLFLLLSTPNHVCHVPGRELSNFSLEQWHNATIPWETGPDGQQRLSQCQMYSISNNQLELKDANGTLPAIDETNSNETNKNDCQYGWDFDHTVWKGTPITRFNWVCDDSNIVTQLFSLSMAGGAIGTFGFAIFSDKYGRRPAFYASLLLNVSFGPAMILSPSWVEFAIFRFCLSLAYYTMYQMPFLIVVELCNEKLRSFTVVSTFISFIISMCLVSLLAWLIAEWKTFLMVTHLPSIIFLFYWGFIPESPRWLLSQGKISECEKTMRKIASVNGKIFSSDLQQLLVKAQEEEKKKIPITKLFSSWVLMKHLVLMCLILSLSYIFHTGISLNIHNMTGNLFVNFLILSLFDIPGNIIGSVSGSYLGRRMTAVLMNLLSGTAIFAASFYITDKWILVSICGISSMLAGATVLVMYVQVGELFPTPLRATAYGITGIVGMASIIIVPNLIALGRSNAYIPYYIMCGVSMAGAVLCTFLPETLGNPLPQTLKEATKIGKNQPYLSVVHKWNSHKLLEFEKSSHDNSEENKMLC